MHLHTYRDESRSRHLDLIGGRGHPWSIDLVVVTASGHLVDGLRLRLRGIVDPLTGDTATPPALCLAQRPGAEEIYRRGRVCVRANRLEADILSLKLASPVNFGPAVAVPLTGGLQDLWLLKSVLVFPGDLGGKNG